MTGAAALLRHLSPGERVFLPGSAGEAIPLIAALSDGNAPPLDIVASFVPGLNPLPLDRFAPGTIVTSMFAAPGIGAAQAERRFRHLPLSYAGFAAWLTTTPAFDVCVAHVAPPDAQGNCSLGPAVEFTSVALRRARRKLAVINPRLPRLPGADSVKLADFDVVQDDDFSPREYSVGAATAQSDAIAARIADFVADGAALQIGLGKIPDALLRMLTDRRRLRLHSGMLSDGARALLEGGSLDPAWQPTSCVHVGSGDYYAWLADRPEFAVRGCDFTHAPHVLAGIRGLVTVNAALSVDLFGQANLEMLDGRMVSGVGGAADFARAAALSPDGISIVALPSTSGRQDAARIVPRLDGPVSLPRHDIDVVVTEQGVADLRACPAAERAERLIAVAAPQHRSRLGDAWRDIAGKM